MLVQSDDTGVTNGDVEWLFRGKSKKLTKKLNLDRTPSLSRGGDESNKQKPEEKQTNREAPARRGSDPQSPKSEPVKEARAAEREQAAIETKEKRQDAGTQLKDAKSQTKEYKADPKSKTKPEPKEEKPSSRRLSVSLNDSRRRSSFSFMSITGGGQPIENMDLSSSPKSKSRGFFSSISQKFKSSTLLSKTQDQASQSKAPQESGSRRPSAIIDRDLTNLFKKRPLVDGPPARVKLNRNKERKSIPIQDLRESRLKRVAFAVDKLQNDPQQQIPLRRPRRGSVLIPEDLMAPLPRLSQGISNADVKALPETRYTEREIEIALAAQKRALIESGKHAMEAHLSAKKLAAQINSVKLKNGSLDEEDVNVDAGKIEIDKPLHAHENHFLEIEEPEACEDAENASLEAVYTRCCHLREILPIPATLKQLKDKSRPLQVLKLLNPRPTLIDVLSFADFIAITQINTIIFDNVTMTTEMLKHLLGALVLNEGVEKLLLRNVAIDDLGWLYLCEFLVRNPNIKKLDISQQRVKLETKQTSVRAAMNWDLFVKTLVHRNGIEELVMGGCNLPDETFEYLIEKALTIRTNRFGVAATSLSLRKCEVIADWISRPDTTCVGVDVAYNDLSGGKLKPFIKAFQNHTVKLIFFSLNLTSLTDINEVGELLQGLSRVQTLKFLDLSSLPELFPALISKLRKCLPQFTALKRAHFDLNELSSQSIGAIADILPKMKALVHVSLMGNRNLDRSAIGALYTAVKMSDIFTLDIDYELVPDELSQRLALYLIRNLDHTVRADTNDPTETKQDDLMFDGSLLMETAEKILSERDANSAESDLKVQLIVTNAFIERTHAIRKEIHKVIDTLFKKRNEGSLTFDGKESLLRFCLLDASLEKLVHLFEQKIMVGTPLSPSPSVDGGERADLAEHEQLHANSRSLLDLGPILMAKMNSLAQQQHPFQPHMVVEETGADGVIVPVDNLTGRPVLMRSVSQTSVYAREQELEEGEFHKWGYFVQHQLLESKGSAPVLKAVPSGSELREAIIDAKGVDSVTELIDKINTQRVSLEKIYSVEHEWVDAPAPPKKEEDTESIDSGSEDHEVHPVVHEAYDKLLNEAERVRSNTAKNVEYA